MGRVVVVGSRANRTSARLVESWRDLGLDAELVGGRDLATLVPGDVALGRLDVLPGCDGVEPGLFHLLVLERRGGRVLNTAAGLLAAHDKLRTTKLLRAGGLPQPRSAWVRTAGDPVPLPAPLVVKPRFGSWGVDVHRCETDAEARRLLVRLRDRPWFRRHGALVQELVPPAGRDLRVLVAAGKVIGAAVRTAAPGEWRTNVSLGGRKKRAEAGPRSEALALAAAAAVGCDLAAVDLLPTEDGPVVLEVNAAADFDDDYAPPGVICDEAVARALGLLEGVRCSRQVAAAPPRTSAVVR
ncbi:MAG: ATP-grasp domain-containing protein [Gaiella sp.]|nr:ATP-grasp domain-containing protein [Gaiella sp.]